MSASTPGIYIHELQASRPGEQRLRLDVAGFVGLAPRGPVNRPQPLTSWEQYRTIFGGRTAEAYLGHCVHGFFLNGGRKCWVVRTAHPTARRAHLKAGADGSPPSSVYFEALNEGAWGNRLSVRLESRSRDELALGELLRGTRPNLAEGRGIALASASGLREGDRLTLAHSGRTWQGVIQSIAEADEGGQIVAFHQEVPDFPICSKVIGRGFRVTALWRQGTHSRKEIFDNLTAMPGHQRHFLDVINGDPQPRHDVDRLRQGLSLLVHASDCASRQQGWMRRPKDEILEFEGGREGQRPLGGDEGFRYLTGYASDGSFFRMPAPSLEADASPCGAERRNHRLRSAARRVGLAALEEVPEVGGVAIPDLLLEDWLNHAGPQAEPLPPSGSPPGLVRFPNLKGGQRDLLRHCRRRGDCFAILDSPRGAEPSGRRNPVSEWALAFSGFQESRNAGLYYPWLEVAGSQAGQRLLVPPSGHLAGVMARSDENDGPGKPPANEALQGVVDVEFCVSDQEQARLNPIGVNCTRSFPGRGLLVWGARTLSPEKRYRYVNVRRLALSVIKFLNNEMKRFVFEPNDPGLWSRIEVALRGVMLDLFQRGNLAGDTPEEAFFVQCDAETNPPANVGAGQVIARLGFAPAQPLEFILLTIIASADTVTVRENPRETF